MSIRDNNEKTQMEMNPRIYGQINHMQDNKVKMIYHRYRMGKTIIMDDLKYLCLRDPEGCDKLAKNIIEPNTDIVLKVNTMNKEKDSTELSNSLAYKSDVVTSIDTLKNIPEIMTSVKSMIEKMNEKEREDISKNLYDILELKKLTKKMKYWDDTFLNKMGIYSNDGKNEYDILA